MKKGLGDVEPRPSSGIKRVTDGRTNLLDLTEEELINSLFIFY